MVKRDSVYWLARLQRDAPAVYADFLGGKFKSLAEARIVSHCVV